MDLLLLPLLLIAVFYFLLIRPQQRQKRQMAEMQQSLAVGSTVMTSAGLIATVAAIDDEEGEVELEVSPGVTNRYVRRAIARVIDSPATGDDPDDAASLDDEDSDVSAELDDAESGADEKAQNSANDAESR
ncbi:preprotein translocase subunit YajC [Phytoactinopolyspora endophytica]|uniref:preprotein translocase subunit YajC n=1 Tax=Phytoactinopolyspora endophytica TaxID=1642495 RepID=UPI00101DBC6B|nr:preprotein translocase subunit YajC [Phytoactinopolyspora endophytica]